MFFFFCIFCLLEEENFLKKEWCAKKANGGEIEIGVLLCWRREREREGERREARESGGVEEREREKWLVGK